MDVVLAVRWIRDWWRNGFPLWDEPREVVDGRLREMNIWILEEDNLDMSSAYEHEIDAVEESCAKN